MAKKKITITIEESLYEKVRESANKEKRTLSQQICKLVEDKLSELGVSQG